jgi:hypothetical protein
MSQLGLLALAALIAVVDIPKLWKNGQKRDLWVFSAILLTAFTLIELHMFHFHIISPDKIITTIVQLLKPAG